MFPRTVIIRGAQVNYYFICHTKLWLFSHFVQMESNSELVSLGKLIHERCYSRKRKEVIVDNTIAVDFIKKGKTLELHEVKKSRKMEKAHEFQLVYYLYYLKKKGITARGVIDYPKIKKRACIELTAEREGEIMRVLEEIKRIIALPTPPLPKRKRICKKCSYYELCFG